MVAFSLTLRPDDGGLMVYISFQGQEETCVAAQHTGGDHIFWSSAFCSVQAPSGLHEAFSVAWRRAVYSVR